MANNTLDTGKEYIHEVFGASKFYNVPEYQRAYVWERVHVCTMLDDIATAMSHEIEREYFLGCMILNSKEDKKGGITYEYKDILDGQQRFITLFLLQAVIRDLSEDSGLKHNVDESLHQKENSYKNIPGRNRLEFSVRKDGEFLNEFVIKPGATFLSKEMAAFVISQSVYGTSVKKMTEALSSIHTWWQEKKAQLTTTNSFQDYLSSFYVYLSTKVLVLHLSTSDSLDDAYNLFTVLNSRGVQLQSSDILRAQNLGGIKNESRKNHLAAKWDEYAAAATDGIYKTFDEFLWALLYIVMKYASEANKNLSKGFEYMNKQGNLLKGDATFELIGRYIGHLEAVAKNNYQSKEAGLLYENLNYILANTFGNQYLMVLMHYRECFGEENILDFLIKIDNLFSALWLLDSRAMQIQTRSFIIMRKMDEISKRNANKIQASLEFLQDKVLAYDYQDEKATTAIDIDKFYSLISSEEWGSFTGTRVNKSRYLLLKLDLLTGSDKMKLDLNKSVASIEHIMPQKLEQKNWEMNPEFHKLWLHKLGNIALIDMRKNSSFSNLSYDTKKAKFKAQYIESRPNTTYIFDKYAHWDESAIKKNHQRAVTLLKNYYEGNSLKTFKELNKKVF